MMVSGSKGLKHTPWWRSRKGMTSSPLEREQFGGWISSCYYFDTGVDIAAADRCAVRSNVDEDTPLQPLFSSFLC